ncbi:site-2 protease family protein [Spirilliplanes yamanashiensis]|uniref:Zinc metalloprotease n=1 Tax=Spirilliplanes yamanashiensis TaxID=42233 RepID=A0A8J4DMQ4_9ACTN|nr:site-2 protease family protein [Spirilliplanes yamanashiensis]MDP9818285.1 Zn-dependent protease/CBS domain-containing protein [Spirilliplanes yamanashiensis]GIJ06703.1 putative zinc metalloprotease Rip3 [Spirilliplanes yamanashiensis]
MRQTIRFGRVAGIPIGVHWSVFVILVLLTEGLAAGVLPDGAPGHGAVAYWVTAAFVAAAFLAALLGHELAHSLAARHYRVGVRQITLWLLGGVSELDGDPPHPRAALVIAGAGPAASLVAAGVFAAGATLAAATGVPALARVALAWLALVNLVLAAFNLLPGAPLDGGRVLAAVVWWIRGDRAQALRAAGTAGTVVGGVLVAAGFAVVLVARNLAGLWWILLGWFLIGAARTETAQAALAGPLARTTVGQAMGSPAVCGYTSQSVSAFVVGVVRHQPHRAYPVLDLDGRVAGTVTVSALLRVPAARRPGTLLSAVLNPSASRRALNPGTTLPDAADQLTAAGGLIPVLAEGRLCGVLTATDLRHATEVAALGGIVDRTRADGIHPAAPT